MKSYKTYAIVGLIMGGTRYLRTHAEKANLEPYRKSGDMKPFVILSVS